jgi:hypothetical protein
MTTEEYRRIALALPEATESAHMNHPDFRVRGKIFATLWPKERRGVVKLTPEQQELVTETKPEVFAPVPGGWGRRGATMVHLELADEATVGNALLMAWRNIAPKSLGAACG